MKKIIKLLLFVFISNTVFSIEIPKNLTHKNGEGFIENKGQILDQNGIPNVAVKYLLNGSGLNVQIRNTGFSYDTYTIERKLKPARERIENNFIRKSVADSFNFTYHYHRVDIEFVNANKQPKVLANQVSTDFINYYNVPTSPDGILNVHNYKSVLVKDIYSGIDVEYLIDKEKGFKYNFIVHPGADYQMIQMKYLGAESNLVQNKIELSVAAGKLQEDIPMSWIEDDANSPVQVDYKLIEKGVFGFGSNIKILNNKTLVIDPSPLRIWGSYYGGNGTDYLYDCKTIGTSIVVCGMTTSSNSIATAGAHQSSISSGFDVFVSKFTSLGVLEWSSYYGGTGNETIPRCAIDGTSNIVISGITTSSANISSSSSHQTTPGGGNDAFLVKFSGLGVRQWGTYYGGNNSETEAAVSVDPNGNIYLSGSTASANNISTTGSHQIALTGITDGFLVRFTTGGVRQWGTYYGGSSNESNIFCISTVNGLYLSGNTNSTNNIATATTHQSVLSGSADAFLVKFDFNGSRLWGTYYGGSGDETGNSCAIDNIGNVYLAGTSNSTSGIATTGSSQAVFGGGTYDAFLAGFTSTGVRYFGTYLGGNGAESLVRLNYYQSGKLFLSGETRSSNNISTTGAFQVSLSGLSDVFFAEFNTSGTRQWSSYFGGTSDEGFGLCVGDDYNNVYLVGYSNSSTNISTTGGHQISMGGGVDGFLQKFQICTSGVLGTIGAITPTGGASTCNGTAKQYTISAVTNAAGHQWSVPAGWVIQSGQGTTSITVLPGSNGNVSVKGYNTCGDSTTAVTLLVTVISVAQPSAITGSSLNCLGVASPYSVALVSGRTYIWTLPNNWTGSSTTNSISVTPNAITNSDTIRVTASISGCQSTASKLVVSTTRIPLIPVNFIGNNPACRLVPTNFMVDTFLYEATYIWTFPTGYNVNSGSSTRIVNVTPSASAVSGNLTVKGTNSCGTGTALSIPMNVPVTPPATPSTITGSAAPCSGSTLTYSVTLVSGINYRWVLPLSWTINSGQNTNSITVKVGTTSGSISVYPSNATSTSCEGTPSTLPVTVVATPVAPTQVTGATQVCINSSYSFTTPAIPGTQSYTWTLPTGFSPVGGTTNNTINVNTSGSLGSTLELKVKANNGSCSSVDFVYNITGNTIVPAQPLAISGNQSICANSTQTYSIAAVANASSYAWSLPAGWAFNGNSTGNSINVVAGSSTGTISVVANNGSCASSARTLPITTVTPSPPQPGSIGYSGAICGGKQTAFTIAAVSGATSYIWTLPSGWTGTSTTTSINVTPNNNSDTLIVVASNGSCNSVPRKQGFIVNQTPAQPATITGNNLVCINTSYPFYIPRISTASSYTWTVPTAWSVVAGGNDTFIRATPNATGVSGDIVVIANNNGCASIPRTIATSVNTNLPATPGAIIGSSIVCDGVVNDFSISSVTNALNYTWTIPTAWTFTSGQNTTSIKVVPNNTNGQITVKAINGACVSAERVLAISTVVPPPAQPVISGNANPCINSNATFTVAAVPGAISYLWTSPIGWTISAPTGQGTSIFIAGQTGVINVSANNGYCKGIAATLTIDASQLPNIISWEGEQYVKSFTIRKYKAPSLANTSYVWTVPSDWTIISGSTQNEITVLIGQSSGVITVRGTNGCGTGASYSKNVYTGVAAGMDTELLLSNLKIFPQPANDQFTLSFMPLANLDEVQLRITDMLGKAISVNSIGSIASGQTKEINFTSSEMIAGIYLLSIESKQTTKTYKISINH